MADLRGGRLGVVAALADVARASGFDLGLLGFLGEGKGSNSSDDGEELHSTLQSERSCSDQGPFYYAQQILGDHSMFYQAVKLLVLTKNNRLDVT